MPLIVISLLIWAVPKVSLLVIPTGNTELIIEAVPKVSPEPIPVGDISN
jgi:hypothetical protein